MMRKFDTHLPIDEALSALCDVLAAGNCAVLVAPPGAGKTTRVPLVLIDEFASRFDYIYSGYLFANYVFALSDRARAYPVLALAGLALWAVTDAGLVYTGASEWPVISLALGLAGACAIITIGTLLAKMQWLDFLRYFGEHSIVIYLAFFLPMAATRTLLLKTGVIHDIGTMSVIVTAVGVVGSIAIWWATRGTRLGFLFERPDAFWIAPKKRAVTLQAAE
jgi:uncharacterized membrane protein YcfT